MELTISSAQQAAALIRAEHAEHIGHDAQRRAAVGDEQIVDGVEGDGRAQKAAGSGDFQPRPLPRIRQPSADDQAAEHVHGPRPEAPEKDKGKMYRLRFEFR